MSGNTGIGATPVTQHSECCLTLLVLPDVPECLARDHRESAEHRLGQSLPFLESLSLRGVARVLDVGLRYGRRCRWFAALGKEVLGVTIHPSEELKRDAARYGYRVRGMDMHALDLPDGSFDVVRSRHCLEHSFSPLAALLEWSRALRPRGYLPVTVPLHRDKVVSGHFVGRWNIRQVAYMLCCAGYDVASGHFVKQGDNVRGLVREAELFAPQGMSWFGEASRLLPESLRTRLEPHPRSLGGCTCEGDLMELTSRTCAAAQKHGAPAGRLSLFGPVWAACKVLLKGTF